MKKKKVIRSLMGKAKAFIDLQDCNGTPIEFPDLEPGESPAKGDKADVDGKPAEGNYTMPDGTILKMKNGVVVKVVEPSKELVKILAFSRKRNYMPLMIKHAQNTFIVPKRRVNEKLALKDKVVVNGQVGLSGTFNGSNNTKYKLMYGKLVKVISPTKRKL